MKIGIKIQANEDGINTEDPEETMDFTLRALRAVQVLCERKIAGNDEPVLYRDERVKGFALTLLTPDQCMLVGCHVSTPDMIRIAGSILCSVKKELTDEQFYSLLMALHAAATDEESGGRPEVRCKKNKDWGMLV